MKSCAYLLIAGSLLFQSFPGPAPLARAFVDVEIQNADFGLDFNSTNFCTIRNVTLTTSSSRAVNEEARGSNGHHGIDISHGTENLVTNFSVKTKFVHDISVDWYALHTVFSDGNGVDLNMDHHREANYSSRASFRSQCAGEG
jgi:hypothetical protein